MGNTEIVREFIKEIKEKYPNIKMSYSYDEKEDETEIFYHLKEKSSYQFESLMGKMLYEKFHKSEIYNIYFNPISLETYNIKIKEISARVEIYDMKKDEGEISNRTKHSTFHTSKKVMQI